MSFQNEETNVKPTRPASVQPISTPLPAFVEDEIEGTLLSNKPPVIPARAPLPEVAGYSVIRELARGGMGAVYLGHDPIFDRPVAIKVMHPDQDSARFVIEAKVTAQLPHPGVPPVHALGKSHDGRPFLVMKLIEGRTLSEELKDTDRSADLAHLVSVFEHICLTVGFAHSQGVIHRDLKPSNIMVGSFGEVQVMDWGLAKSGVKDYPTSRASEAVRMKDGETAVTVAGEVRGTPAYMAPEQARGEPLDARADVFALGGILAVILTGKPPFSGTTVVETINYAAAAKLTACFAELDTCAADPELIAIAKRCLAAWPGSRHPNGKAVADAIEAYRKGVEERLRRAERDRAVSEAEVREQRKRRRAQLALVASVGLFLTLGSAFAWYSDRRASERKLIAERDQAERNAAESRLASEQAMKAEQARRGVATNLKLGRDLRGQYKFAAARAAISQAAELAAGSAPELLPEIEQARADLAMVERLDDIRYRKWLHTTDEHGNRQAAVNAAASYASAFTEQGLDPASGKAEAARLIAAREIRAELVAALDDWVVCTEDRALQERLLNVARLADPSPWLDRLRDPAVRSSPQAVDALAAEVDPTTATPNALVALIFLMQDHNLDSSLVINAARASHPTDFDLAFVQGTWAALHQDYDRQLAAYEAARALRPDNAVVWNNLGGAMFARGDLRGAANTYRAAVALSPNDHHLRYNFGVVLHRAGDFKAAIAEFKESLRIVPDHAPAWFTYGNALTDSGDLDGGIDALRQALHHDPVYAAAWNNLGVALRTRGDLDGSLAALESAKKHDLSSPEVNYNLGLTLAARGDAVGAIASYRKAIELRPTYAEVHANLGTLLGDRGETDAAIAAYRKAIEHKPELAPVHYNLGLQYAKKGDQEAAIASYSEAARRDPTLAPAHRALGTALQARGDHAGAIKALKQAVKWNPRDLDVYDRLAAMMVETGDLDGAAAICRESVKLDPRRAEGRNNLASALSRKGDIDGAIRELQEAVKLQPKLAAAHANLGVLFTRKNDANGAIGALRKAVELDPGNAAAQLSLGIWLNQTGDLEGAAAAYAAAVKANPKLTQAHGNLAVIRFHQQKYPEAIAAAQAALEVDPRFAQMHAIVGLSSLARGDVSTARVALAEAARLDEQKFGTLPKLLPPLPAAPPPREARR